MAIRIEVLHKLCRSCDACVPVCPHLALRMRGDRLEWDAAACQGCRACVVVCPARALVVHEAS